MRFLRGSFYWLGLCLVLAGSKTLRAEDDLLFSGMTDTGWQIFVCDLETEEVRALTSSVGDKRTPRYSEEEDAVLFRDSYGQIMLMRNWREDQPAAEPLLGLQHISDLFPVSDSILYFNRMVTGNAQRRMIWRFDPADEENPVSLALRKPQGSLRQIRISPDGKHGAFTWLWRRHEERLHVFAIGTDPVSGNSTALTPEFTVSGYPFWLSNDRIGYSRQVGEKNFDLFAMNLADLREEPLVTSEDASELAAILVKGEGDQEVLFYERHWHENPGEIQIVRKELDATAGVPLKLGRSARDPWWIGKKSETAKEGGEP